MGALLLALSVVATPPWVHAGTVDGVSRYTRARKGNPINEIKATSVLEGSPRELWAVLTDFEQYVTTMPSTSAAVIVARDSPQRTLLYLRYALPLLAPRDTLVEMVERRGDEDGRWVLSWNAAPGTRDVEKPVQPGVVRLRVNEGLWQLEPRDDGRRTFVTYQLLTAPGGDLPPFFVNHAKSQAVPGTFQALQRAVLQRRGSTKPSK